MVYESVPADETVEQESVRPPVVSTTDQWLERISDQLQVFVDMAQAASEDDEFDADVDADVQVDGASDPGVDDKAADVAGTADPGTPPAKKTAAKRAEVKGD